MSLKTFSLNSHLHLLFHIGCLNNLVWRQQNPSDREALVQRWVSKSGISSVLGNGVTIHIFFKGVNILLIITHFFLLIIIFFAHTHGTWMFLGQGLNPCHGSNLSCCRYLTQCHKGSPVSTFLNIFASYFSHKGLHKFQITIPGTSYILQARIYGIVCTTIHLFTLAL